MRRLGLLAERERLERLAGDHLQLAALTRLGALEALRELAESRELAGAKPVRAGRLDPAAQLRVADVPPEPAGDERDQPVFCCARQGSWT